MGGMDIYSTADAADELGCSTDTIVRWVGTLGLGRRLQGLFLTRAEVDAIGRAKRPAPGNPNFGQPAKRPVRAARKPSTRRRPRKAG